MIWSSRLLSFLFKVSIWNSSKDSLHSQPITVRKSWVTLGCFCPIIHSRWSPIFPKLFSLFLDTSFIVRMADDWYILGGLEGMVEKHIYNLVYLMFSSSKVLHLLCCDGKLEGHWKSGNISALIRSSSLTHGNRLSVSSTRPKKHIGRRGFAVAAPAEWNNLPQTVRSQQTIDGFRSQLKTYLFRLAYLPP